MVVNLSRLPKKKTAYLKDIGRTIRKESRRFFSILVITMLGVMMFSGLKAACVDLRRSADRFFDDQRLHDLKVISTLGLTDEDIEALEAIEGVALAEGVYSEKANIIIGEKTVEVELEALTSGGTDSPYLEEGRWPENASEVLATAEFLIDNDASVGDVVKVIIEDDAAEDEEADDDDVIIISANETESALTETTFTIVGSVTDVTEIDNTFGSDSLSYRTSTSSTDKLFILPEAVDTDIYTSVVITLEGTSEMFCFTTEYEEAVRSVKTLIENSVKSEREEARTSQVVGDAQKELDDAKAEAEEELANARMDLEDGQETLYKELADAEAQLNDAQKELDDGAKELAEQKQTLADARSELENGQKQLDAAKAELEEQKESIRAQLSDAADQLSAGIDQVEDALLRVDEGIAEAEAYLQGLIDEYSQQAAGFEGMDAALAEIEAQLQALYETKESLNSQLDELYAQQESLAEQSAEAEEGFSSAEAQIAAQQKEINEGLAQIVDGEAQITDAQRELAEGQAEIDDGWKELEKSAAEGQAEIDDGWEEYESAAADVQEQLADALAKINDIDASSWYVQDRSSLSGYSNVDSDASSIEAIGTAFPVVFFVVAILISLTGITRMVDEERGLVGIYKSLGFRNGEIFLKYMTFATLACVCGALIGTVLAFVGLPAFVFRIFNSMYLLPEYCLSFVPTYGIAGPLVFYLGILLATYQACHHVLKKSPASLMRPKTPRAGSHILLEHFTPLWKRLSFLNKVTARNLFRYKKRMFMTVFGIAGCMALLLFGFGIKDSVSDLMPRQYEEVFNYDMMAVSSADDNEKLIGFLDDDEVADYINCMTDSAKIIITDGEEEDAKNNEIAATLIVVPDDAVFSDYVSLESTDGQMLSLSEGDIYITRNAGSVLGFSEGDTVSLQLSDLQVADVTVTALVQNYLVNYAYMAESTWKALYEDYAPNSVLVHLSGDSEEQIAWCKEFKNNDGVLSCVSIEQFKDEFSDSFQLINAVVYVIIAMSGALALVVCFTLSSTNISEREREIATIKVLGFYNHEVHVYIQKETYILSAIGILAGVPIGWLFAQTIAVILNMPSIYLAVSLHLQSYFFASALTVVFTVAVTVIMDRVLNRIDPADALKSVE